MSESTAENEYRDALVRGMHQAAQSYDRTLITLATGALAGSVLLVGQVFRNPASGSAKYLVWSWLFLGLSLLTILIAMLISQAAFAHALNRFDSENEADKAAVEKRPGGSFTVASWVLNILAGGFLVAGGSLLFSFIWMNRGGLG